MIHGHNFFTHISSAGFDFRDNFQANFTINLKKLMNLIFQVRKIGSGSFGDIYLGICFVIFNYAMFKMSDYFKSSYGQKQVCAYFLG